MKSTQQTLPPQDEVRHILQRYDLAQAFNLAHTYEELRGLKIQPEFILALLEVFEDPRVFQAESFQHFNLQTIIDYLHKTHAYYMDKKLPEIEQSIHLLMNVYPDKHPLLLLLNTFYLDYRNHLGHHIEAEEKELMPYIERLEQKAAGEDTTLSPSTLSVQQFIEQHHDTEKDLEDIRNTILHYSPPAESETLYRILLSQLQVLETDLAIHALIEDKVLLPRALALEKKMTGIKA